MIYFKNLLDMTFYASLVACGISDFKSNRINNKAVLLMFLSVLLDLVVSCHTKTFLGYPLGVIIAVLVLYIIGVIGGGDTKVFILSALYFSTRIFLVVLSILVSLAYPLTLREEERKKAPLLTIFAIMMVLGELLI